MKIPRLAVLAVFFGTFTLNTVLAESFDSSNASIKRVGPNSARLMVYVNNREYLGLQLYFFVPIKFADGANWSTVKDYYIVPPEALPGLQKHDLTIIIGRDGSAIFHEKKG